MTVEFRILGPLEVDRDGGPVELGSPRERALLALLLTRANQVVSRDRLIDELWPDSPPRSAVNVVQTYVSHLRKALTQERLATRPPGYLLRVEEGELDLGRFERLAEHARRLRDKGDAERASALLAEALELWRGPPLADIRAEGLIAAAAARLEEIRLTVLEERIDVDLALGRHGVLVAELEQHVGEHPLRERLRGQLMLALYRSGRQPEALAQYRAARASLADELGIEPGRALRELEAAILRQEPALDVPGPRLPAAPARRAVVVVSLTERALEGAVGLSEPLARRQEHEVVVVRPVQTAPELTAAAEQVNAVRARLAAAGSPARATAFTSAEPAGDVVRLVVEVDAALLVLAAPGALDEDGRLGEQAADVLARAPCDVAVLLEGDDAAAVAGEAPVVLPFAGAEHEWAAAELAAWMAQAEGRPLRLVGTADSARSGRDACRLLASVALLVQQVADVPTEPALVDLDAAAFGAVTADARAVVAGVPDGWRERGVGRTRALLLGASRAPVLLVRGGLRPGGLAPPASLTRFTWTVTPRA